MLRYYVSRASQAIVVLWAAFTLSFVFLQLLPGDAILIRFSGPDSGLSADQVEAIRAQYDMDAHFLTQYLGALADVLKGDWGYSLETGAPVAERLAAAFPESLKLVVPAFVLAVVIAFGVGLTASYTTAGWLKNLLLALPAAFSSVPVFWVGVLLTQWFSFQLALVPTIGGTEFERLILPVITLALPLSAPIALVMSRAMDAVYAQPFVMVAASKGATRPWILRRHVIRNGLVPTMTIAGLVLAELIGGAVVTEAVFGRNGVGSLTVRAIAAQDVPVLQAVVLLSAAGFVVVNLIVDVLNPLIDPKLKAAVSG